MWPYWFIDLNLTCSSPLPWSIGAKSLLKLPRHMWFVASKPPTCPSHLQPVHRRKALSWSSPPWAHDSMSCLICNELLFIITCGLITCVSPYSTLLVHLILSLNYQNQTRTFHPRLMWFSLIRSIGRDTPADKSGDTPAGVQREFAEEKTSAVADGKSMSP